MFRKLYFAESLKMRIYNVLESNGTIFNVDEIKNILTEDDILLPEEYMNFIAMYDNSTVRFDNILIKRLLSPEVSQDFYLAAFLTLSEFRESYKYYYKVNPEKEIVDAAVAIIGRTNGRTCICIGLGSENLGQIFLWDGDFGVTKQAESLSEFFDSLVLDESNV